MIQIRPLYEDLGNTRQFYPKTHVRAVIDDTGESIENKLGGQSSYIISQTCNNLSEAINLIPLNKRFPGMSIKYKNSDKLVSWEYLGSDLSNFENLNYWRGTDLTVVLNSNNYVTGNGIHNYVNELISTIMVNPGLEVEEDITETLNGWETNDASVWTVDCNGGFNGTITCKSSPKYKRVGINLSSIPTDSKVRILFDSNIPYYIKRAAGIGRFSSLGSNATYNSIEPDLIGDYDSDNLGVFICDETGHYDFVFKKKSNYITIGADSHSSDINVEWVISNFQIKLITQSSGSGSSLSDVLKRLVFTTGTIPSEYTYERYMDISANSSSGKNGLGSCVYGNYFFAASEASGSSLEIKVYDLENKELILTLTINGVSSNTHANCLSFGPDNSDIFPYLYIPSGYLVSGSLKVYVYRITGELGTLTATKVYTINLSGFGEWADFFVDSENSRCWVRSSTTFQCYSLPNGDSTLVNNVNTLESFTLPDLTFGYSVTKTSNQGCMYRKGRIWLTSGVPSYSGEGADSCCIIVVNVRSKCRESVIWLNDVGLTNGKSNVYEPEGIFVWNDEIYIPYRTFIAKLIKTDKASIPSNISAFNNDVGYLTEHLDISNKADKSEIPTNVSELVNDVGYINLHLDISGKADKSNTYTKQEVDTAIANVDVSELLNNYYTKLEIDEAGYITDVSDKANIDDIPTKTSELINDSGFLTLHQDISGKADKSTTYTKSEIDSKETELVDLINFKSNTNRILDDNGNSVEQRLQENLDLINQKQLEVGAVPSDVTPTEGSTNWVTSGGINKLYSATRTIFERDINGRVSNIPIEMSAGIRYTIVLTKESSGYTEIKVTDLNGTTTNLYVGSTQNRTIEYTPENNITLISLYSTPTGHFSIYCANDDKVLLTKGDVVNNMSDGGGEKVLSAEMGKELHDSMFFLSSYFYPMSSGNFAKLNGQLNNSITAARTILKNENIISLSVTDGYKYVIYGKPDNIYPGNTIRAIVSTYTTEKWMNNVSDNYLWIMVVRSDGGVIDANELSSILIVEYGDARNQFNKIYTQKDEYRLGRREDLNVTYFKGSFSINTGVITLDEGSTSYVSDYIDVTKIAALSGVFSSRYSVSNQSPVSSVLWYDAEKNYLGHSRVQILTKDRKVFIAIPDTAVYAILGFKMRMEVYYRQDIIESHYRNSSKCMLGKLKKVSLIICHGQSLMVGADSDSTEFSTRKLAYQQIYFLPTTAEGSTKDSDFAAFQTLSPVYNRESPRLGLAEMLFQTLSREDNVSINANEWEEHLILLPNIAQGSTSIETLSSDENYAKLEAVIRNAKRLCDEFGYEMSAPAWVWFQGENNIGNQTAKDTYKNALLALHDRVCESLSTLAGITTRPKCIIYQPSSQCIQSTQAADYGFSNGKMGTPTAFAELLAENDEFLAAAPTYILTPAKTGGKYIHCDAESYNLLGAYAGYALKKYIFDDVIIKGVIPLSFTVSGNTVKIKYNVPSPPLCVDTNWVREVAHYGYTCVKSDNTDIVTDVSVYWDEVTITCSESPVGCKLRYGLNGDRVYSGDGYYGWSGRIYGGRGNIRDNQGNAIYKELPNGKILPMHNWAYTFEKLLEE